MPSSPQTVSMIDDELFVFEGPPSPGHRLKIAARRYTTSLATETLGVTLLFAHCVGMHKEIWEPTIERIFSLQNTGTNADGRERIREIWSFDWQNHGDAAILNRVALDDRRKTSAGVSVVEWAQAIAAFIKSPRMQGHRIVGIGHSAGASAMVLAISSFALDQLPYTSIILVEPTIITQETYTRHLEDRTAQVEFLVAATAMRRTSWPSREAAFAWLAKRVPWSLWDPRAIQVYTDHGLYAPPSSSLPSPSPPGMNFVLKCDRKDESLSYTDTAHFDAAVQLGRIAGTLPVHVIWGTRCDIVPQFIQDDLTDASQGRPAASVVKIPDAGHMVVQEKPDSVAEAIAGVLNSESRSRARKSKL